MGIANALSGGGGLYENKDKLFYGIRRPVSYLDKLIVNANWYREGVVKDGSAYVEASSFQKFEQLMSEFASANGLIVEYNEYMGQFNDDQAKREAERISYENFKQEQCDQCYTDDFKHDTSDKFFGSSGKIKMKNGDSYDWYYKDDGGYWIPDGWFGKKPYPTLQSLVNALEAKCKKKYCQ